MGIENMNNDLMDELMMTHRVLDSLEYELPVILNKLRMNCR